MKEQEILGQDPLIEVGVGVAGRVAVEEVLLDVHSDLKQFVHCFLFYLTGLLHSRPIHFGYEREFA
jgi:hypothetical protein